MNSCFVPIILYGIQWLQSIINTQPGGWRSKLSSTITVIDFDAFLSRGTTSYQWPNLDERTAVGVCFTSGTTVCWFIVNPSSSSYYIIFDT